MGLERLAETQKDHEARLRVVEQQLATKEWQAGIDARVRALEIGQARLLVLAVIGSAAGSSGVALVQALVGGG